MRVAGRGARPDTTVDLGLPDRVDCGKTDAAIHPIALPHWAVALLRRRKVAQPPNELDAVFVSRNGTW